MKQDLLDLLEKNGYNKYFDELYANDVTVEDFVKAHPDIIKIPGAVDVLQSKATGAPHNLSEAEKDAYFFEDPESRKKYEAEESALAKELEEKQRLAAEYQRARDIQDFSELSKKKSIGQNLAAIGMKLVPQAAKNEYIKKGMEGDIGLQAGLGTVANLLELLPGIGKIGKAATVVAGPAIRAGQKLYQDDDITLEDLKELGKEFTVDAGINAASYLPLRDIYRYGKSILGKAGRSEKLAKESMDELLKQADALENAAAENARLKKVRDDLLEFDELHPDMNDIDRLKFADNIREDYPELAKAIEEETIALAKNKEAYFMSEARGLDDAAREAAYHAEGETANAVKQTREKVEDELTDALNKAETRLDTRLDNEAFDAAGNLNYGKNVNLEDIKLATPSTAAKTVAKTAPVVRGGIRAAQSNGVKSVAPEEKEHKAAIDWTIDKYKRQWDAGFKPHKVEGDLLYEAWKVYDERNKKGK